jgi:hypothetical protein
MMMAAALQSTYEWPIAVQSTHKCTCVLPGSAMAVLERAPNAAFADRTSAHCLVVAMTVDTHSLVVAHHALTTAQAATHAMLKATVAATAAAKGMKRSAA